MQPGPRAGIVPALPHPGRRVREETLARRTAEAACLRPCTALPFPRRRSVRQCGNENSSFREGDLRPPFGAHLRFYFDSSQPLTLSLLYRNPNLLTERPTVIPSFTRLGLRSLPENNRGKPSE